MDMKTISELASFIKSAPTAFHAVEKISDILREDGFEELRSKRSGALSRGRAIILPGIIPVSLPLRQEGIFRTTAFR